MTTDPGLPGRSPRAFTALWAATGSTNLADGIIKVSLPLFALSLTRTPALVAAVSLANTLPWLLFALPAGAMADRLDRRRVIINANFVRVGVAVLLTAAYLFQFLDLPVLYAAAFLLGLNETFADTTRMALVQSTVPREKLESAYAKLAATETLAGEFVGPPLGGLLAGLTLAAAAGAGGLGYLAAAVFLLFMPGRYRSRRSGTATRIRGDIMEGLRYVWRERRLRVLLVVSGVSIMCWSGWLAVLPLYVLEPGPLGLSSGGYGLLVGVLGVGGMAGAFLSRPLGMRIGRRWLFVASLTAVTVMVLLPAFRVNVLLLAVVILVGGVGSGAWSVSYSTLRAMMVPDDMMGRYSGVSRIVTFGAMPIGAGAAGALATGAGLRAVFIAGGVVMAAVVVATMVAVRTSD